MTRFTELLWQGFIEKAFPEFAHDVKRIADALDEERSTEEPKITDHNPRDKELIVKVGDWEIAVSQDADGIVYVESLNTKTDVKSFFSVLGDDEEEDK